MRSSPDSFDQKSQEYFQSRIHREGEDLEILSNWVEGSTPAVDVACGAGHTANAVKQNGVRTVIALDPAPNMVKTALTEYRGLKGLISTAEALPLQSGRMGAVTCRIAAHHFTDVERFLHEAHRVLRTGGILAFEDNIAPADPVLDEFINRIETWRDPTHVRSYTREEWEEGIRGAGFEIREIKSMKRTLDYETWIENQDPPGNVREQIRKQFMNPPSGANDTFNINIDDGEIQSFRNLNILVRAVKSSPGTP